MLKRKGKKIFTKKVYDLTSVSNLTMVLGQGRLGGPNWYDYLCEETEIFFVYVGEVRGGNRQQATT